MCSTPFGVIGLFTLFRRHFFFNPLVLNAVWRHWIVHDALLRASKLQRKCSTPFGVIGLFTLRGFASCRRSYCAQRRLASLDCSHVGLGFRRLRPKVLNAVWRHWIVHPPESAAPPKQTPSAQRRLASLDCSPSRSASSWRRATGAQRRLASLDCSRFHDLRGFAPSAVLNAVWRHWIVHTAAGGKALREPLRCSTPFGVIGLFTRRLNIGDAKSIGCSTPFGVIGLFTRRLSLSSIFTASAQRRLASLDCSQK